MTAKHQVEALLRPPVEGLSAIIGHWHGHHRLFVPVPLVYAWDRRRCSFYVFPGLCVLAFAPVAQNQALSQMPGRTAALCTYAKAYPTVKKAPVCWQGVPLATKTHATSA